jgi:hypothetical protein
MSCERFLTSIQTLKFGCVSKKMRALSDSSCISRFSDICYISDQFLQKFSHLKKLTMVPSSLIRPETLENFPNLEKLVLRGGGIFSVENLTNLRSLKIETRDTYLGELTNLTNLTSINFDHCRDLSENLHLFTKVWKEDE